MAMKRVTDIVTAQNEEVREREHENWLARKIYSKTTLTTYLACPHKFYLRNVLKKDEFWGVDLVEGIAGHKLLEVYHAMLLDGETFYPDAAVEIFSQEFLRLAHRLERPANIDESRRTILPLFELYRTTWKSLLPNEVISIEETWGIDREVTMGGRRVAGHLDLRCAPDNPLVVDFKIVNPQSAHRRPKALDLGMEMYKHGVSAKRTAILPLVKGLKGGPKIDDLKPVTHTPQTKEVVEMQIDDLCGDIEAGRFPASVEIGQGLCQPKYCSFFGRECKYTRSLGRNWSAKEE